MFLTDPSSSQQFQRSLAHQSRNPSSTNETAARSSEGGWRDLWLSQQRRELFTESRPPKSHCQGASNFVLQYINWSLPWHPISPRRRLRSVPIPSAVPRWIQSTAAFMMLGDWPLPFVPFDRFGCLLLLCGWPFVVTRRELARAHQPAPPLIRSLLAIQ